MLRATLLSRGMGDPISNELRLRQNPPPVGAMVDLGAANHGPNKSVFCGRTGRTPFFRGSWRLCSAGNEPEPQDYLRPSARSTSPSEAPNSSLFSIAYSSFCPASRLVVNSGRSSYHGSDEAGKIPRISLRKVVPDPLERSRPTRSTGGHAPVEGQVSRSPVSLQRSERCVTFQKDSHAIE